MARLNLTDFGNHRVRCESEKTQQKFLKSVTFLTSIMCLNFIDFSNHSVRCESVKNTKFKKKIDQHGMFLKCIDLSNQDV